jgi:hypothetical protein
VVKKNRIPDPDSQHWLQVEGTDQYAKLIRRPYLLAFSTAAWIFSSSGGPEQSEDWLCTGQESGDLIVWSITGDINVFKGGNGSEVTVQSPHTGTLPIQSKNLRVEGKVKA